MSSSIAVREVVRHVKQGSRSWPHQSPKLTKIIENDVSLSISIDHDLPLGSWSEDQIRTAINDNAMQTTDNVMSWTRGRARQNAPIFTHGKGVYLFDKSGKKYLDWTSQVVCANLGYDLPEEIINTTMKQMKDLPYTYGGLGLNEIRARLSKLIGEILPGDLQGSVFPSSGGEANEAAIMIARRYTGKFKVINWYRSYHGGTANSLQATGDFRRMFGGDVVPGFVKAFNPFPLFWDVSGESEEERTQMALNMLEEQVLNEGPDTIAMISLESVVGGAGVLVPPPGYMQGVRAICDKYDILLHFDEVMVGFGRTGKMFGFQHFPGVIPDIVTGAKGLSSAALPISLMATRKDIMESFEDKALGWGSTYQAHPVAMACAYENIKYLIRSDVVGNVRRLSGYFEDNMRYISNCHPSIKQYRCIGLLGCFDTQLPDGQRPKSFNAFVEYKKAYNDIGLIGLLRPPLVHVAPPLIITEEEMSDGFERQDKVLYTLDKALGF